MPTWMAFSLAYRHSGIGSELMTTLKFILEAETTYSIFRFLTVDAYLSAIPFYDKNDFTLFQPDDEDKHTRLMYFDMTRL